MREHGRKRKLGAFRKKGLNSDARVIVALLKKQPQTAEELRESASISRATFYRVSQALEDFKIMKKVGERYVLWNFCELKETVADAVEKLKAKRLSFKADDVAAEVGKTWSDIEKIAYTVAKEYGLEIHEDYDGRKFFIPVGVKWAPSRPRQ